MASMKSVRLARGARALLTAIAANVCLAAVKITAGVAGRSQALIADGIESLTDLFVSAVVWRGFQIASEPADERHPYGHGKAEAVAAFCVALILLLAALAIVGGAVRQLVRPHPPPKAFTLLVLLAVVGVKETMFRLIQRTGKELDSAALRSEAWHQRSDAITSGAAAIGISIAVFVGGKFEAADEIAAMAAAGVILYNARRILREAMHELMDAAADPDFLRRIRETTCQTPGVHRVEKCFARKSGPEYLVDMHLEVDPQMSVGEAHKLAHRVKDRIRRELPAVKDVLIHIEPASNATAPKLSRPVTET